MARPRFTLGSGSNGSKAGTPAEALPAPLDLSWLLTAMRTRAPSQWSENVFELSRHFVGAIYVAINTLGTHASRATFSVYERTSDPDVPNGKIQLPWYDPLHQLFENPNPIDTFPDYLYQTTQQLNMTGLALTWAVPSNYAEEPGEFYNLQTANCVPMPPGYHQGQDYPHGCYRYLPYQYGQMSPSAGGLGVGQIIPAEQVIRLKNHHPFLRSAGYAAMTALSQQIDTIEAIDKARNSTMHQGCDQSLSLKAVMKEATDPSDTELKRLRKQFEQLYAGPTNAGKVLIPPVGWEIAQVSTVPKDMAWTEGWSQILDLLFAGYGTPKAVTGMHDNLTYATLYASLRAFGYFSLGPLLGRIAARMTKDMIHPAYGRRFGIELTPPEFVDPQLEINALANDLKCGALKINEYRKARGWDHTNEEWGNERAIASFGGQQAGGDGGRENRPESTPDREEDPNVNNARPTAGKSNDREEILGAAFDKAKLNGHLKH